MGGMHTAVKAALTVPILANLTLGNCRSRDTLPGLLCVLVGP